MVKVILGGGDLIFFSHRKFTVRGVIPTKKTPYLPHC